MATDREHRESMAALLFECARALVKIADDDTAMRLQARLVAAWEPVETGVRAPLPGVVVGVDAQPQAEVRTVTTVVRPKAPRPAPTAAMYDPNPAPDLRAMMAEMKGTKP